MGQEETAACPKAPHDKPGMHHWPRCTCRMTEEGSGKLLSIGTTVLVIRPRQRA
jgi:hypothetical protein